MINVPIRVAFIEIGSEGINHHRKQAIAKGTRGHDTNVTLMALPIKVPREGFKSPILGTKNLSSNMTTGNRTNKTIIVCFQTGGATDKPANQPANGEITRW